MDQNTTKSGLKKELRQIDIWGLALGAIIGWGCFVLPGTAFLPEAGPGGAVIGLMLGAVIMSIISISYGYLIQKYPVSGGEFVYADSAFGRIHAFICGWFIVLAYWSLIPLNSTAIAMISRYIFPGIIQVGKLYSVAGWDVYLGEIAVATIFIVGIAIINIKGIKSAGWTQTFVALALVFSVLFAVVGVFMTKPDLSNLKPSFAPGQNPVACVIAILAYTPYCFIGFDCIPQAAEEYTFSHKKALKLMVSAILLAGVIYSAIVIITAVVKPWLPLIQSNPQWATGEMVDASVGRIGVMFIAIAMLCAVLASMNAFYIASSRLIYSMSLVDALPKKLGMIDTKHGTPKNAILFLMVISLIAPWFGRQVLVWIVDMTAVGGALAFCYTTASASVIAKRFGDMAQCWISRVGFLVALIFIVITFVPGMPGFLSVPAFIILGAWILLGLIFFMSIRQKYIVESGGKRIDDVLKEIDINM